MKHQGNTILRVLKTCGIVLLAAACLLGLIAFILGAAEQRKLRLAAEKYQAVTVRITETRFSDRSKHLLAVVLEPLGETPVQDGAHREARLGKTVATTGNRSLAVGDTLTMYYDPQNTDTRIVDFGVQHRLIPFGAALGAGTGALLLLLLVIRLIRKKRASQPAVHIEE
ncbi:MAG: hypothetical protein IKS42_02785 [Oscillospiraceae bacterium]|nr:hypothetical protein [Oscillospiraceae bacterium]